MYKEGGRVCVVRVCGCVDGSVIVRVRVGHDGVCVCVDGRVRVGVRVGYVW